MVFITLRDDDSSVLHTVQTTVPYMVEMSEKWSVPTMLSSAIVADWSSWQKTIQIFADVVALLKMSSKR